MRDAKWSEGKRNGIKRLRCFLMFLMMLFCCSPALAANKVSNDTTGYYYCAFYGDTKTAELRSINDNKMVEDGKLVLPETVQFDMNDGNGVQTYTVTALAINTSTIEMKGVTEVVIPQTVTTIYDLTAKRFPDVTKWTIPGTVKTFKGNFQHSQATEVIFEEGVETIGDKDLLSNSSVTEIVFPDSLKTFDAHLNNSQIKSVVLPACVTTINDHMFLDCTELETVTANGTITAVAYQAFRNCEKLTTIPSMSSVTTIGQYSFYGCSSLTQVPDLSNVTKMGKNAFENCENMSGQANLSSLKEIPDNAFYDCGLTGVSFSNELTSIGNMAFESNPLTSLTIPQTVTSIGESAFKGCNAISGDVYLPDGLASLGVGAFQNCENIDTIYVGPNLTTIPARAFSNGVQHVVINNAKDNVTEGDNAFDDVKTVTYLVGSVDDVGDTFDETGESLQEAVNKSMPGDTIVLKKDVRLSKTLNIPAGKDVTILSEDGHLIIADPNANVSDMINVENGARLVLSGVKLNGRYNSSSIIYSAGAVELAKDTKIWNATIDEQKTGVIEIRGSRASLTIGSGASVSDCTINGENSAPVLATDGGCVKMTGGVIEDNTNISSPDNQCGSAGILILEDASGEMTGGVIRNNTGVLGAAINLISYTSGKTASFKLDGDALITGNSTFDFKSPNPYAEVETGAVHVEGYASLTMNGGTISKNVGGVGAGVAVFDYSIMYPNNVSAPMHTSFTMNGGKITGNNARGSGGGVYSLSNDVYLFAGEITNNTAGTYGGGVYSEGSYEFYSTLNLQDALVENNTAEQGGGVWLCPSGSLVVEDGSMVGIFNNKTVSHGASTAGDDVVNAKFGEKNHVAKLSNTLQNYLPGGGTVEWYKDGLVYLLYDDPNNSLNGRTSVGDTPRYGQTGADPNPVTVRNERGNLALKAIVSDADKELARSETKLKITGNSAWFGGGIGANGGVKISGESVTIQIAKTWNNDKEETRPDSVDVQLYKDGKLYRTVTLKKADGWKLTLIGMPKGKYTFVEIVPNGYSFEVKMTSESNSGGDVLKAEIVNTYVSPEVLPKTGDHSSILLWGVMLCIACAGIAVMDRKRRC